MPQFALKSWNDLKTSVSSLLNSGNRSSKLAVSGTNMESWYDMRTNLTPPKLIAWNRRRKRFGEKNECSSVCFIHQPKSLFEISLLLVRDSTSTIRRENIRLKTELEKTKGELKASKDKMRKTIFSVDTIRNNDKLCKHYTGFPNFCHNFSHFIAPYRFLWVFQGYTEEMKHASLAVSAIITVLALVKTALKSACTTFTSWLDCIDWNVFFVGVICQINPKQLSITGKNRKKNLSKTKQVVGSVCTKTR